MNGEELDQILRFDKNAWLEMSEPERSWHLFKVTRHNMSQPQRCMKKFVTRKQIIIASSIISSFLAGAGIYTWKELLIILKALP
jgi:hypothetical protein